MENNVNPSMNGNIKNDNTENDQLTSETGFHGSASTQMTENGHSYVNQPYHVDDDDDGNDVKNDDGNDDDDDTAVKNDDNVMIETRLAQRLSDIIESPCLVRYESKKISKNVQDNVNNTSTTKNNTEDCLKMNEPTKISSTIVSWNTEFFFIQKKHAKNA